MLVAGASSIATMAKSLHTSGINKHKNKQKPKSVIGRSTESSRVKAVVTRQIDMFVSRLSTYTNDDAIKECLVNVMSGQFLQRRQMHQTCVQAC